MKISLVSVLVNDPKAAYEFYTRTLGFVSRLFMPEANLAIVASPEDVSGPGLLLEPNDNPIAKPFQQGLYAQGLPAIVFEVRDAQAEYARLRAMGVQFRQIPEKMDYGTVAVLDDTCGNWIQIVQPPAQPQP